MPFTAEDVLGLDSMHNATLLSGSSFLSNMVSAPLVLTKTSVEEASFSTSDTLQQRFLVTDFVPTESEMNELVTRVENSGIAGIAFRSRVAEPQPVLEDSHQPFPVILLPPCASLEIMIYQIMDRVMGDEYLNVNESTIERMINEDLTQSEVGVITKSISNRLLHNALVAYITSDVSSPKLPVDTLISQYNANLDMKSRAGLRRYKAGIMVFITKDHASVETYAAELQVILEVIGLKKDNLIIGLSDLHPTYSEINKAFKEAYQAHSTALIEEVSEVEYKNIGVYTFLLENTNSEARLAFAENYLAPILNDPTMLDTLTQYIHADYSLCETSARMFCHKNTVRYRVNKLHGMLDPLSTENQFLLNATLALRIHKISQL